jgi:CheY-like chemotaxis protein
VAEDDATNRMVIRRQLALLGRAAEIVEDGHRALEAWRAADTPCC